MGIGILVVKYNSLANVVSQVYPEIELVQTNIWNDFATASYFVKWLKEQPESELAYVNRIFAQLRPQEQNTLCKLLQTAFPQYVWTFSPSKKSQNKLKDCLERLISGELLQEYKHPDISHLELDFFYPQYKLAFEYQVECISQ